MKRWFALLGLVLLLAWPAGAVLSPGHLGLTRLWSADWDRSFVCTAFYVHGTRAPYLRTLVTAGHCTDVGTLAARTGDATVLQAVDWRAVVNGRMGTHRRWDAAIGTAPDPGEPVRPLWLAESPPDPGTPVWVAGFPEGVESVVACRWVGPARPVLGTDLPGSEELACPPDTIRPGSSGSPVVRADGFVVGVVWGRDPEDPRRVLVTPVTAVHALWRLLEP